jgi:hypothetical protein
VLACTSITAVMSSPHTTLCAFCIALPAASLALIVHKDTQWGAVCGFLSPLPSCTAAIKNRC